MTTTPNTTTPDRIDRYTAERALPMLRLRAFNLWPGAVAWIAPYRREPELRVVVEVDRSHDDETVSVRTRPLHPVPGHDLTIEVYDYCDLVEIVGNVVDPTDDGSTDLGA